MLIMPSIDKSKELASTLPQRLFVTVSLIYHLITQNTRQMRILSWKEPESLPSLVIVHINLTSDLCHNQMIFFLFT